MSYYVENVERVVTDLYSFSDETTEVLKRVLLGIAARIEIRATTNLVPHVRRGKLISSLRRTVKAYTGNRGKIGDLVSASVVAGGTRGVRYAHAFERGFDAVVQVPAHQSRSRFGKKFSVKAYELHHKVKAAAFLDRALKAEADRAPIEIGQAIGAVAVRKGFA